MQAYRVLSANGSSGTVSDCGDGNVFTWLNNGSGTKSKISLYLSTGLVLSSAITFKPMITPVSYNGPYVPYAKTNRELTEDVAYKTESFTYSGITINVKKWGRFVEITLDGRTTAALTADETIATCSFPPASGAAYFQVTNGSGGEVSNAHVNSSGLVKMYSAVDTNTYIRASCCYMAN